MNGSWDVYLASPADFAGMDDIITNLAREIEPGIEIIERTPLSSIITSLRERGSCDFNLVPRVSAIFK